MAPLNVSKCLSISSFLPLQLNTWVYFQIDIDNQTDQMNPCFHIGILWLLDIMGLDEFMVPYGS